MHCACTACRSLCEGVWVWRTCTVLYCRSIDRLRHGRQKRGDSFPEAWSNNEDKNVFDLYQIQRSCFYDVHQNSSIRAMFAYDTCMFHVLHAGTFLASIPLASIRIPKLIPSMTYMILCSIPTAFPRPQQRSPRTGLAAVLAPASSAPRLHGQTGTVPRKIPPSTCNIRVPRTGKLPTIAVARPATARRTPARRTRARQLRARQTMRGRRLPPGFHCGRAHARGVRTRAGDADSSECTCREAWERCFSEKFFSA